MIPIVGIMGGVDIRRTRPALALALALSVASACDEAARINTSTTVTDSAGVTIIEAPLDQDRLPHLVLSDRPVWRVGWDDDATTFERVEAAVLLADGRSVVVDGGRTLRALVISAKGDVVSAFGGSGEGPGEFRWIDGIVRVPPDLVGIQDERNRRLSLFSLDGRFVGEVRLGAQAVLSVLAADSTGHLFLGMPQSVVGRRYPTPWKSVPLVWMDRSLEQVDTVAWADWDQSLLFGARSLVFAQGFNAVSGGQFVVGRGDRAELRWIDTRGDLRQVLRWGTEPRPLTDVDRSRVLATLKPLQGQFPEAPQVIRQYTADLTGPVPIFGRLIADANGDIWLQEYRFPHTDDPLRYLVVTPAGAWAKRVDIGPGDHFTVLDVRADHVLVRELDDWGVQSVAVYELRTK